MATSKQLESMTSTQLVEVYNNLGPARPLKSWSKSKGLLIERINSAQKQSSAAEKPAKKKGKVVTTTGTTPKRKRTGEILELCETLLQQVAYHENKDKPVGADNMRKTAGANTRPVGLSFADILADVRATFPDANTSYACLRWYATHLRHSEVALPRRPKSSWK